MIDATTLSTIVVIQITDAQLEDVQKAAGWVDDHNTPLFIEDEDADPQLFTPQDRMRVRRWLSSQPQLPYFSYLLVLCSPRTGHPYGPNVVLLQDLP